MVELVRFGNARYLAFVKHFISWPASFHRGWSLDGQEAQVIVNRITDPLLVIQVNFTAIPN
ncbi:MAG: hypothetical protein ACI9SB_000210 [Candidatus Azotimanducaceae bacterium]